MRAQGGGPAAARAADDVEVPVAAELEGLGPSAPAGPAGPPGPRRPAARCSRRVLGLARASAGRSCGDLSREVPVGQRVEPRAVLVGDAERAVEAADRVDHGGEVGVGLVGLHRLGLGPARRGQPDPVPGHRPGQRLGAGLLRTGLRVGTAATDPAALEGHQRRGAAAHEGAAGLVLLDPGGVGGVDDVAAVVLVGDPQRDPQVGVGADVGRDHATGSLGGQHQVDAERAAALGDGDQAVHEVGQLGDHAGELVDDQHQPRDRAAGRAGCAGAPSSPRGPWPRARRAGARGDAAPHRARPARDRRGGCRGR